MFFRWEATVKNEEQRWENIQRKMCKEYSRWHMMLGGVSKQQVRVCSECFHMVL
jgi:hypothetical protein